MVDWFWSKFPTADCRKYEAGRGRTRRSCCAVCVCVRARAYHNFILCPTSVFKKHGSLELPMTFLRLQPSNTYMRFDAQFASSPLNMYLFMLPQLTCAWRYRIDIISRTLFDTVIVFVISLSQLNFEIMNCKHSATYQGWPARTASETEFRRNLWQDNTKHNMRPLFDGFFSFLSIQLQ